MSIADDKLSQFSRFEPISKKQKPLVSCNSKLFITTNEIDALVNRAHDKQFILSYTDQTYELYKKTLRDIEAKKPAKKFIPINQPKQPVKKVVE